MKIQYPEAPTADQSEDLHGTRVEDPYRPLEDPHAGETRAWIDQENEVTQTYLGALDVRSVFTARLKELLGQERHGVPQEQGGHLVYSKNDGLQNQDVLWIKEGKSAPEKVLIDPNTMSKDGTVALGVWQISPDGRHFAYTFSASGSDWSEIKVKDVATGKDLPDHLKFVKFSGISWSADGAGFYYSRYPEPDDKTKYEDANYFHKLYFHKLGTSQDQDELIYERSDRKEWGFGGDATEDGTYLVIHVWKGTDPNNLIFVKNLAEGGGPFGLVTEFEASYTFLGNDGPLFYLRTTKDAGRGRVITVDVTKGMEQLTTVVPETKDKLEHVTLVGDSLYCHYLEDARSVLRVHGKEGGEGTLLDLPGVGCVEGLMGERRAKALYFSFQSMTQPSTIYQHDTESRETELYWRPEIAFDPEDFETRQVFYESKDGTRIPLFLAYKKGLKPTGDHPTILYGYGGFGISVLPWFRMTRMAWLEAGGIYAQACLRGGGEYGQEWHDAGTKHRKQNVFDDFIAGAEYLIREKWTRSEKLAISGGSNGGLLVGACMTQRPELFGAALPAVGVLDMLRFHKFTIGWAWTSDYGTPEDPKDFEVLRAYSPLHNLRPGERYPSTLITTADHDDRVVPAHSFKFAAALQKAHAGDNPVLIRIETKAGHGAGKPIDKIISEQADIYAFLAKELKIDLRELDD